MYKKQCRIGKPKSSYNLRCCCTKLPLTKQRFVRKFQYLKKENGEGGVLLITEVEQQNRWAESISKKFSTDPIPSQHQKLIKHLNLSILILNITQREHISIG